MVPFLTEVASWDMVNAAEKGLPGNRYSLDMHSAPELYRHNPLERVDRRQVAQLAAHAHPAVGLEQRVHFDVRGQLS